MQALASPATFQVLDMYLVAIVLEGSEREDISIITERCIRQRCSRILRPFHLARLTDSEVKVQGGEASGPS